MTKSMDMDSETAVSGESNSTFTSICNPAPQHPPPEHHFLSFDGCHENKIAKKWRRKLHNRRQRKARKNTGIPDSGAMSFYYSEDAPVTDVDPTAPAITMSTATGQRDCSKAMAKHQIPNLPSDFLRTGHVMPGFKDTLLGIGPICNVGFTVTFCDQSVTIQDNAGAVILTGWQDQVSLRI